jgi:hypothetical protein
MHAELSFAFCLVETRNRRWRFNTERAHYKFVWTSAIVQLHGFSAANKSLPCWVTQLSRHTKYAHSRFSLKTPAWQQWGAHSNWERSSLRLFRCLPEKMHRQEVGAAALRFCDQWFSNACLHAKQSTMPWNMKLRLSSLVFEFSGSSRMHQIATKGAQLQT